MARLFNYDTNEEIEGAADGRLVDAACASDRGVFGMWSESDDQWILVDESQVGTLRQCRPEPRIVPMYALP